MPSAALNRITWHSIKGWDVPYPKTVRAAFSPFQLDDDGDEPLHIFFFGLWQPGEQRRGGRMVEGVIMEQLRKGRQLRTMGGGVGGRRVRPRWTGRKYLSCEKFVRIQSLVTFYAKST